MLNFKSLFNENFYLAQNSDVAKAVSSGIFQSGLDHFQKFGQFEGRNPSASFDTSYYLQQNQDIAAAVKSGQTTAVEHFLQYGQFEGRNPNIFFDTSYYLQQNQDIAAAVKSGQTTAVEHFLQYGQFEGRNPDIFFDTSYYLQQNQDIAAAVKSGQTTAVEHFLQYGQFEGRNPDIFFDTSYYLQQNQDIAAAVKSGQTTAVKHFLQYGQFEGRNPDIFFDTSYYLQQNQDIAAGVKSGQTTAVKHFLQYGQFEGRNPDIFFDTSYYLQQNQDIAAGVKSGQTTAVKHFLEFGEKQGRNPIASFDNNQYLKRYSDVADGVVKGQLPSAYRHFVVYGSLEKRFGVNAAPIAMDDTKSTIEGTAIKISVLANDTDFNKDTLSITNFTKAAKGEIVDNKDGTFTYTPNSGFTGSDSFNYSVTDSYDGIATGKVNFSVVQKPSVTLALASKSVLENSGTGLAYTFTRSNVTDNALTVNFNIGGDAVFGGTGADYTQLGAATFASASSSSSATAGTTVPGIGTVMFKPGEATAIVTLTPVGDTLLESDETVALTLADGNNYTVGSTTPVSGTIKNDDTSVTLALASNTVLENSATGLAYTFKRIGVTDNELTVNFNIGGDALFGVTGADYTQSGAASFASGLGTVTFGAGKDTATVTLTPIADTDVESDEKVTLTLATGNNYTIGTTTPVIGTIKNDDTSVTLAVAPDGVKEDSNAGLVYTFTRAGVTDNALTVNFGVGGTATFATTGTDYTQSGPTTFTATSGTVTFAANQTTKTVTLTPKVDNVVESDETIALTLKTGNGYTIGTTTPVTSTIKNDDTLVTVAVAPDFVKEDSGTGLVYTFTRTGAIDNDLTVNFNVGGNADFDNDYDLSGAASFGVTNGTVMFKAGENTATVTVTPIVDTVVEANELVTLSLGTGTGYTLGTTTTAVGTIKNDDTLVTLAVTPNSVDENSGIGLDYTFTRTGVTDNELTVNFNVGGTASADDYTQLGATFASGTGTVTFNANDTTKTVKLTPKADNAVEADETVALTLANGTGYNVGTTTAVTSTIKNDDTLVTLAVGATNTVKEDSGTGLVYTFTRTVASDRPLTVNFNVNGDALLDTDYTQSGAASFASETGMGTVMFAANETTKTVILTPKIDKVVEADETATLTLADGTNYTVGTTTPVTGTIKNDDTSVTLEVLPASVLENSGESLIYKFTRTGVTDNDLTVNFAIAGNAVFGGTDADYTQSGAATFASGNGTVTFTGNQTTKTVTLTPVADNVLEPDETIALTLGTGNNYTVGTTTAVTGTIKNDDASVTLEVSPTSVLENSNGSLIYKFTRTGRTDNELTVNFNVAGTAVFGGTDADYIQSGATFDSAGTATVKFLANDITKTVTLTPVADNVVEADETVIFTLANGTNYTIGTANTATSTITNDDKSTVSISAFGPTAYEGGTNGTYRISRGTDTIGNLAVNLTIDDTGTFKASANDYTLKVGNFPLNNSMTVTIADGQSYVDVTLAATDDVQAEADETLKLNLANGSAYIIDTTNNNATVTIAANDTVVTNTNDSASQYQEGSLRQAWLNAIALAGPNTITFQPSTTPQTITLAAALPTITGANADNTTIDGTGASLTVSGANAYQVFSVNGVTANFNNLTIANGKAQNGAGINQIGGTVNVNNSTFSNNSVTGYGAGISSLNGMLNVTNSNFSGNSAAINNGGGIAIGSTSTLNVTGSTFNTNMGGAIHTQYSTLNVTGSTFNANTDSEGAIYNFNNSSTLTIASSTFTNNSPANVSGSYTDGGGNTPNPAQAQA